jgi:hypothetical protein
MNSPPAPTERTKPCHAEKRFSDGHVAQALCRAGKSAFIDNPPCVLQTTRPTKGASGHVNIAKRRLPDWP